MFSIESSSAITNPAITKIRLLRNVSVEPWSIKFGYYEILCAFLWHVRECFYLMTADRHIREDPDHLRTFSSWTCSLAYLFVRRKYASEQDRLESVFA